MTTDEGNRSPSGGINLRIYIGTGMTMGGMTMGGDDDGGMTTASLFIPILLLILY